MKSQSEAEDQPHLITINLNGLTEAGLLSHFSDEMIEISGRQNNFIESVQVSALKNRWFSVESVPMADTCVGAVVHRPIGSTRQDDVLNVQIQLCDASFKVMSELERIPAARVPIMKWLILGPGGTFVSTHQDVVWTASWNLLVSGRKRWRLWPPASECPSGAPTHVFVQDEGEAIWIPEGWWHDVVYEVASICISKNLVMRRSRRRAQDVARKDIPSIASAIAAIEYIDSRRSEVGA